MEDNKKICCENCIHETPRHSIFCQSCLGFQYFESKFEEKLDYIVYEGFKYWCQLPTHGIADGMGLQYT